MKKIVPSIVWSSSLGVEQTSFGNFGYIQISELGRSIFVQEYVGTLKIEIRRLLEI